MRILVLGGTEFIGLATARRLLDLGHHVTVFHRGEQEPTGIEHAGHIHGDRANILGFRDAFAAARPDAVLDMRAMSEATATAALAAIRGLAPRAVVVSSVDVYRAYGRLHGSEPGPIEPMPLTEASPVRDNLYPYRGERGSRFDDYDKIPVERAYLDDTEVAGTVVRLPAVHGEGDYQHRLFIDVARFDARRPFVVCASEAAEWIWPRAYVGNVAHAIALAVTDPRASRRVYNAPCDPPTPQAVFQREVGRIAGWNGQVRLVAASRLPEHLASPLNYAQDMVIDGARMRAELGYVDLFTPDEGLRRAIAWERAHPPRRVKPEWLDFSIDDAAAGRVD